MTARSRILSDSLPSNTNTTATAPQAEPLNSDFIVILAALLCALICVLGLVAVSRCSWIRNLSSSTSSNYAKTANKGLKKKALKALPKTTYDCEKDQKFTECAICLTEFSNGEEMRVLPQCGHGYHVACIDTWLGSHSSCPSCRQILVVETRCKECNNAILPEPRENHVHTYLP